MACDRVWVCDWCKREERAECDEPPFGWEEVDDDLLCDSCDDARTGIVFDMKQARRRLGIAQRGGAPDPIDWKARYEAEREDAARVLSDWRLRVDKAERAARAFRRVAAAAVPLVAMGPKEDGPSEAAARAQLVEAIDLMLDDTAKEPWAKG